MRNRPDRFKRGERSIFDKARRLLQCSLDALCDGVRSWPLAAG